MADVLLQDPSEALQSVPPGHRSGYVAIVGQPNVGKSTLLNAMLNFKLAIVSSRPQTTRNRILGIRTDGASQIIFVDTPGLHPPHKELNRLLLEEARRTIAEVDLILYLADAQETAWTEAEQFALQVVAGAQAPRLLVPNKIDRIEKSRLLPLTQRYVAETRFEEVVPISALVNDGVDRLLQVIVKYLPEGPRYYPGDQLTELTEREITAEVIREKIFLLTAQEIPYSSAVLVDKFEEVPERRLTHIYATIHLEKDSQKGILIGRSGQMLREIGRAARLELERMLGSKVFLELFVRVEKNWTKDPRALRKLGMMEK